MIPLQLLTVVRVLVPAASFSASTNPAMSRRQTFRQTAATAAEILRRVQSGDILVVLSDVQGLIAPAMIPSAAIAPAVGETVTVAAVGALPRGGGAGVLPLVIVVSSNVSGESTDLQHVAKRPRVGQSQPPEGEFPSFQPSQDNKVRGVLQRASSSSNGATSGKAYRWRFFCDGPVTEDPASMAMLAHHFKLAGCQVPAVRSMACRDEYTDLAEFYGLLMAHVNCTVTSYKKKLASAPELWSLTN